VVEDSRQEVGSSTRGRPVNASDEPRLARPQHQIDLPLPHSAQKEPTRPACSGLVMTRTITGPPARGQHEETEAIEAIQ
jgi:hypothetical protein